MTAIPFDVHSSARSGAGETSGSRKAVDLGGRFPWGCADEDVEKRDPEFIICNLALGDLTNNLREMLTIEGRVHAESYLAASGALAGFAAQQALIDRLARIPADKRTGQLMVATTKAGEKFYFGDMLNGTLIARRDEEKRLKIWPLAFNAAISAGMERALAPRLETLFGYVAGQISAPFFPSASTRPAAPAKALLMLFWPLARQVFEGEFSARALPEEELRVVSQHWRPVIAGRLAADCLLEAAKIMPPAKALTILMESAIYGSKVDPAVVKGARRRG